MADKSNIEIGELGASAPSICRAPELIQGSRFLLRRPRMEDVPAVFRRYASDPDVTRYLAWPRHVTEEDSRAFVAFSDAAWAKDGVGPYLIELRAASEAIGSTGLALKGPEVAETGYVLAKDMWGRGLATEALRCMVELATSLQLKSVVAYVHPQNPASIRVLEKARFCRSSADARHCFPNLGVEGAIPVIEYVRSLGVAAP